MCGEIIFTNGYVSTLGENYIRACYVYYIRACYVVPKVWSRGPLNHTESGTIVVTTCNIRWKSK